MATGAGPVPTGCSTVHLAALDPATAPPGCSPAEVDGRPSATSGDYGRSVAARLSPRLAALVDALPLRPDSRVLEVGCGPGAAARAVADRLSTGQVLAVDRSATAVEQALRAAAGRRWATQVTAGGLRPTLVSTLERRWSEHLSTHRTSEVAVR